MGASDFSELAGSAPMNTIRRGATQGLGSAPGSGTFCYAARALAAGSCGLFANLAGLNPALRGLEVSIALRRNGGEVFVFGSLQGTSIAGVAYRLGLDEAGHITLSKGSIASPLAEGLLARSSTVIAPGTWAHLRMLAMVTKVMEPFEVALSVELSESGNVSAPLWLPVPGMRAASVDASAPPSGVFLDDGMAIHSGSPPLVGGRMGWAFRFTSAGQVAMVDHMMAAWQN